jgi:hypothetical protein
VSIRVEGADLALAPPPSIIPYKGEPAVSYMTSQMRYTLTDVKAAGL